MYWLFDEFNTKWEHLKWIALQELCHRSQRSAVTRYCLEINPDLWSIGNTVHWTMCISGKYPVHTHTHTHIWPRTRHSVYIHSFILSHLFQLRFTVVLEPIQAVNRPMSGSTLDQSASDQGRMKNRQLFTLTFTPTGNLKWPIKLSMLL